MFFISMFSGDGPLSVRMTFLVSSLVMRDVHLLPSMTLGVLPRSLWEETIIVCGDSVGSRHFILTVL